jgi:hypothetical protein
MANALMDWLCNNAHYITIKGGSYWRKKNPVLDKE